MYYPQLWEAGQTSNICLTSVISFLSLSLKEDLNARIKWKEGTFTVFFHCRIICQLGKMKRTLILSQQELLTFTNLLKNSAHKTLVKDGVAILMDFQRTLFYQNRLIHSLPLLLILIVKMRMKFFLSSEENQTIGHQVLMSAKLQQVRKLFTD